MWYISSSLVIHPVASSLNSLSYPGSHFLVILFPPCTNKLTGNVILVQNWKSHICTNIWMENIPPGNCLRKTACEQVKYSQRNKQCGQLHEEYTSSASPANMIVHYTFWVCVTLLSAYRIRTVISSTCTHETTLEPLNKFSRNLVLQIFTTMCPAVYIFSAYRTILTVNVQVRAPDLRYEQAFCVILQFFHSINSLLL